MLDKEAMREAISAAIKGSRHPVDGKPLTHAYIAAELGVTEQAITGWLRTGRIDKRRLPALARITGVPLSTFIPDLDLQEPTMVRSEDEVHYGPRPDPTAVNASRDNLWRAYQLAPAATQRAVELLLLDPVSRVEALGGRPSLVAGIDLLESYAGEALTARKSA